MTSEDNQNRNNGSDPSFCPNDKQDGEVECYEEPVAGTSQDPGGAEDTGEVGDLAEALPEAAENSIPHALQPKNIDMKELTSCTWNLLTENTPDGEEFPPNTLRNIYSKLPSKLSKNTRESLSIPIAFLSVLHLASEKGLTLEQKDNLEDIGILGNNKK